MRAIVLMYKVTSQCRPGLSNWNLFKINIYFVKCMRLIDLACEQVMSVNISLQYAAALFNWLSKKKQKIIEYLNRQSETSPHSQRPLQAESENFPAHHFRLKTFERKKVFIKKKIGEKTGEKLKSKLCQSVLKFLFVFLYPAICVWFEPRKESIRDI